MAVISVATLDRWRHRIPFWWWLTYDALVAVVIVVGIRPGDPAFWLGFAVLAVAIVIDAVEFIVKRPDARKLLQGEVAERLRGAEAERDHFERQTGLNADRIDALELVLDEATAFKSIAALNRARQLLGKPLL